MSYIKNTVASVAMLFTSVVLTSCNDFLDCEPLDKITPDAYFNSESDLAAYSIQQYKFPSYLNFDISLVKTDNNSDDQAATDASTALWVPGEKRTPADKGAWDFTEIRKANYFFQQVLPKYEAGSIKGDGVMIKHYIGEMYFLRAYQYFNKLVSLGDFPIVTEVLPDETEVLKEESKRQPRNKVARFIIEDLDRAIELMSLTTDNGKNRLTKNVALLFKSRVALFEATWLKYHKGTDRVPGGPGWPGAQQEYNAGFSIDIDKEVDWFLEQAMGVTHSVSSYLCKGGGDLGYTRSLVDACLMKNGLPIYAPNSGYAGDVTIENVKKDRDDRLQLFMGAPSDCSRLDPYETYKYPKILEQTNDRCPTGYTVRKFLTYDPAQVVIGSGAVNTYGCLLFRSVEANLNYIEACYEKNGSLDPKAIKYWKEIRSRAGVSDNIDMTIAATDLSKENDWAKYSAGQLVDPTLYNIRRERRIELMSEGTRMRDLKRWRALDQVENYQVEGFNLWGGELEKLYVDEAGNSLLIPEGASDKQPNVSNKENSSYLRVNQIVKKNNLLYDGYTWIPANYLEPISAINFTLTSSNPDDLESSTIYQNPGWSKIANEPAIGY